MNKKLKILVALLLMGVFALPYTVLGAQVHRVSPGESLFSIAQKYQVTTDSILNNNKYLRNHNTIFPKQVLIIPELQKPGTYVVQSGDTLFKISQKLNVSMESIAFENQITNTNNLLIGKTLKIPTNKSSNPTPEVNSYTVKPGDTLFKISQSLGVSMEVIGKENQLTNWNNLHVGQVLKISKDGSNVEIPENDKVYTVKPGDTLYKISQSLGVNITNLAQENNITNLNLIHVGQALKVPNKENEQPEQSFQYSVAQLAKMYPDTLYLRAPGQGNKIALTFDDGPNPTYTPKVLDVLKQHNVPATFFVLGSRVERHPLIAQRIVNEGHVIANHTWIHPNLTKIPSSGLISEMNQTEEIIKNVTGKRTALMRPPYGGVNQEALEELKNLDYKVINWSIDSVDWRDQEVDKILINTLSTAKGNDIVLFHDAGGDEQTRAATVEAIEEIIFTLRSQGYEFVTVDELLGIQAYK